MGSQRHKIRRQVVEVAVRDEAAARRLQREVSRLQPLLLPLIERCCTEIADPDRLHRIDSLEVDLGRIDPDDLEGGIAGRLGPGLRDALTEAIRRQDLAPSGISPEIVARRELLEIFARTGNLPWWADVDRPDLLTESLRFLLRRDPALLAETIGELADEQQHVRRLVIALGDDELSELAASLVPASWLAAVPLPGALTEALSTVDELAGESPAGLRRGVWQGVLRAACDDNAGGRPLDFWRQVLLLVASDMGVTYVALVRGIDGGSTAASGELAAIVEALSRELAPDSAESHRMAVAGTHSHRGEIDGILDRLQGDGVAAAGLFAELHAVAGRLTDRERDRWLATLREMEGQGAPFDRGTEARLLELLDAAGAQDDPTSATSARTPAATPASPTASAPAPTPRSAPAAALPPAPDAARRPFDLSFSESDEIYVENSGLVVLWPFLERFFERLDLLVDGRFGGAGAIERAAGLLQYLCSEDSAPPEYVLGLNKVLCGMRPDHPFAFGPPVSAAEAEEAENLLGAVLAHAPVFENLSLGGLRGSFLLRPGVLGARDGAWLLRVERRTHDVVLDRLPWSFGWIGLPWMDIPLRVEW